jgi:hypothetical protein
MTRIARQLVFALALLSLTILTACGGAPATLDDIPAYPDATLLKPGESAIGSTLANNNAADAALRQQVGVGGKVDQKGYHLPAGTTWDQVKSFYSQKLSAAGWSTNSMVSGIMAQAGAGSDAVKMDNWQKGKQNVSIIMLTLPDNPDQSDIIISLSSN